MMKEVTILTFDEVENIKEKLSHIDDVLYHIETKEYPMEGNMSIAREEIKELCDLLK